MYRKPAPWGKSAKMNARLKGRHPGGMHWEKRGTCGGKRGLASCKENGKGVQVLVLVGCK